MRGFSVEPRTHARCKSISLPKCPLCRMDSFISLVLVEPKCICVNHVYFSKVAFVTEWHQNDYPESEQSDLSDQPEDSEEDAFYDGSGDERQIGVG